MEAHNQNTPISFRYDDSPSTSVIEAVAWVKGVEPTALDSFQDVIDADALDALLAHSKKGTPSVTFEYENCKVRVDSEGSITVRGPPESSDNRLSRSGNLLLLAPARSHHEDGACIELLTAVPEEAGNFLGVTFGPSMEDRLDAWESVDRPHLSGVRIIAVGEFMRSSSTRATEGTPPTNDVHIVTVTEPGDLSALGGKLSNQLSVWEATDAQMVVCFYSLTFLLQNADLEQAFRFLHLVTSRLSEAGAIAHYHMDPEAHDEQTLNTIRPLFDVVLEIDDSGERTIRMQ